MNWLKESFKRRENSNISQLNPKYLPKHVAIIMDGNGRWAQKRGMPRVLGHRAGVEALRKIIRTSDDIGIQVLTLYAFSTENWKRPTGEVNALMELLVEYLQKEIDELHKNNVQIRALGKVEALPQHASIEVLKAVEKTQHNKGLIVNIALNYGSRTEIIDGIKKIAKKVLDGHIGIDDIDEEIFSSMLYTKDLPDPDLVIRTSGEYRISNFLLYQIAYAELWFTDIYWPDFSEKIYIQALLDYQNRNRRFGGISTGGRNE